MHQPSLLHKNKRFVWDELQLEAAEDTGGAGGSGKVGQLKRRETERIIASIASAAPAPTEPSPHDLFETARLQQQKAADLMALAVEEYSSHSEEDPDECVRTSLPLLPSAAPFRSSFLCLSSAYPISPPQTHHHACVRAHPPCVKLRAESGCNNPPQSASLPSRPRLPPFSFPNPHSPPRRDHAACRVEG